MAITKEIIEAVLAHEYTQDDWSNGEPCKYSYQVSNDYTNTREGMLGVATILEAYERVKAGDTTPIDISALAKEFKL